MTYEDVPCKVVFHVTNDLTSVYENYKYNDDCQEDEKWEPSLEECPEAENKKKTTGYHS